MSDTYVVQGVVTAFNADTGRGLVDIQSRRGYEVFSKTIFDSGPPFRFPRVGDQVDAVFTTDDDLLIRVRLRPQV